MSALTYVRLIGFTAGTLLMLFWMVVILGYRRQRNFERVFFFLCLSLFFFYAGSLLALNAQLHYSNPPVLSEVFSQTLIVIGLWILPALLLQLNAEYADSRGMLQSRFTKRIWLVAAYVPLVFLVIRERIVSRATLAFDFITPINSFGLDFKIWLLLVLLLCSYWQIRFVKASANKYEREFHYAAATGLAFAAFLVFDLHMRAVLGADKPAFGTLLALLPIWPLGALVYSAQKHNFLQIGRQRNLVYAVSITFIALLYLSVVRRIGEWLEPAFPPEATAAILVFVLVALFEPLQRMTSRILKATAQSEFDRAQRIMGPIQQIARLGDIEKLRRFIETWLQEQLELAGAKLVLTQLGNSGRDALSETTGNEFEIHQGGRVFGNLTVTPHGAMLSGETRAALEFLCEQLSGALDLCRLIEEKLQLERELAERERMALVGQTAASISHNLKNPLGSIKTILQVQLENPELPESMRAETKMVLEEISRLSAKLNQLLQFSRPTIRAGEASSLSDAGSVLREVVAVLRPEAERRGVALRLQDPIGAMPVVAGPEAVNDILSNLIVNALEAASSGGTVLASICASDGCCLITVEDDGPGIPAAVREKILQPFFTTKSQGTGLGLAITARRVSEFSGTLKFESPINGSKGTRFQITVGSPGTELEFAL